MIFYGNGSIWDGKLNKIVIKFSRPYTYHVEGIFETDDPKMIKKLQGLGYECTEYISEKERIERDFDLYNEKIKSGEIIVEKGQIKIIRKEIQNECSETN